MAGQDDNAKQARGTRPVNTASISKDKDTKAAIKLTRVRKPTKSTLLKSKENGIEAEVSTTKGTKAIRHMRKNLYPSKPILDKIKGIKA